MIDQSSSRCGIHWPLSSGEGSMLPGIVERLKKEMTALAPKSTEINIVAPSDRQNRYGAPRCMSYQHTSSLCSCELNLSSSHSLSAEVKAWIIEFQTVNLQLNFLLLINIPSLINKLSRPHRLYYELWVTLWPLPVSSEDTRKLIHAPWCATRPLYWLLISTPRHDACIINSSCMH